MIKKIYNKINTSLKKEENVFLNTDIFIVEFPKSGVTWLSFILGNIECILSGRNERLTFYNHHMYVPDIHQLRGGEINRILNRTFIKSHSKFDHRYYFVILLIRNPFDVMCSYYNFMKSNRYEKSFDQFVRSKKYGIEAWVNHLESWYYERVDAQRMHFITYENLKKDPKTEIINIYNNLGVNILCETIDQAIELSSLKKMKYSENFYRDFNPNYTLNFVGKNKKITKEEIFTDKLYNLVKRKSMGLLEKFYPELI